MARKPAWAIAKERAAKRGGDTVWLFGIHAVRDALANPARRCRRLVVTPNAAERLGAVMARPGVEARVVDPRRFDAPLEPESVHQGAALEALPLGWGSLDEVCAPGAEAAPLVVLLDRVTDPHNVGAILRSAEVFGARAVVAPHRHSAPETGALAKAASGALERQPYLRVPNLAAGMAALRDLGYRLIGLDGSAEATLAAALATGAAGMAATGMAATGMAAAGMAAAGPVGLVLGAEGPGLRPLTRENCDMMARVPAVGAFGSLNVSNAAAVALYAARLRG